MSKYFTKQGLESLTQELKSLKEKRREIAKEIHKAASFGDLSENAAYDQAKEKKSFNEGRILELEKLLVNAKIIKDGKKEKVGIGSVVVLENEEYTIVHPSEADFEKGRLSSESPIGQAFLGKKIEDEVDIVTPSGKIKYKIVEIK